MGIGVGWLCLRPSLDLDLTGDDFLTIYRYKFFIGGWGGEKMSKISYFFTDYGPQDTLTSSIYYLWGLKAQPYYIFSLLLRSVAALSFILPIYELTKNKFSALAAMAFFMITTTGLETTDWSFNMPSYVAIVLLNVFILFFTQLRSKANFWKTVLMYILFILTIIAQPIRMMFLPVFAIVLESFWSIINFKKKNLALSFIRICIFVGIFFLIYKFTDYGSSAGARDMTQISNNFGLVQKYIKKNDFQVLFSPIAQLGLILVPNTVIKSTYPETGFQTIFKKIMIPELLGIMVLILFTEIIYKSKKNGVNWLKSVLLILLAGGWAWFVWTNLMINTKYPIQPFQLMAYLTGGYFLILYINFGWKLKDNKFIIIGWLIPLTLMTLGFIIPWLRNPALLIETTGRYLIVPAAGVAWAGAIILTVVNNSRFRYLFIVVWGIFFTLHANSSYEYLYHLSTVRGIELTEKIRYAVKPNLNLSDIHKPLVFYFEGDNPEILHHSFIFGFPAFAYFRFGLKPTYIAPTDIWSEVVSAYTNGQGLKRFMPGPYEPVKLENIYAYRLDHENLYDISDEKRKQLKAITQELK